MNRDSCFFILSCIFALYFIMNEIFVYDDMQDKGRVEYQHSLEKAGIGKFQLNDNDELKFVFNECAE